MFSFIVATDFILFLFLVSNTNACQSRWKTSSPVIEFRPKLPDSDLVWVGANSSSSKQLKNDLHTFLKPYFQLDNNEKNFGLCGPQNNYGYTTGIPCIFLRLTQFPAGWLPRFYTEEEIPTDMPDYLKYHIIRAANMERHQKLWVSCEGENPADVEYLGPISYYPYMGFPVERLVNTTAEGYLSPLVAVLFENPARGVLIFVKCTIWAKNIPRDSSSNLGSVHIELMIDTDEF